MKNNAIKRVVIHVLFKKKLLVIFLVLSIIVSMVLQFSPAFILRNIIDQNFAKGITQGVWELAILYLLVVSASNIVEFLKVAFTTLIGQSILMDIRLKMAERMSKFSINYFVKTPAGDTMSRLTADVDAVNSLFSAGIINVVTDMFKIGGLLVSLYVIAPQLIFLEIAVIPTVYVFANFFRKRIYLFQKSVRIRISSIYTFIQEWIFGIRTVKAYSAEQRGKIKFEQLLSDLLIDVNKISSYDSWFPCLMQMLRAIVIAIALWYCVDNGLALSNGLSIGTLVAITDLIGKLFAPIEALATEFQTIQQSIAGISRVNEFFSEPLEKREFRSQPIQNSGIEIENLSFCYDSFDVLKNLTLSIANGEKAVLVGRSGAGKTTLMNIVSGLLAPQNGSVRICGVNPFELPPHERRSLIGVVPQSPQIFDGTIAENISLRDKTITQEHIEHASHSVGIHELIISLPNGYETIIGEGEAGLSSGEIQLLSIARAIVANPKVLLLDEPTSGMDTHTEQKIFDAIRRTSEGRTILSISHRLSGIIDADTVHIVAQQGVVESGSPEKLASLNGWYAMYSKIENAGWGIT